MKYIFTFALLIGYNISFGCVCEAYPSSSNIDEWIGDADFIFEGEYIKDIDWRSSDNDGLNTMNQGVDIYFKISKVFKGDLKSDTIVINQWDNGNCTKVFRKGEKYIVFGYEVKSFLSLTDEYYTKFKSTEDLPPPPPPGFVEEDRKLTTYYHDKEEADQWNRIASRNIVVQTSLCNTFSSASGLISLLEK